MQEQDTAAQIIHRRNISTGGEVTPPRPAGSSYLGNFAAEPIENVRVAIIGISTRGVPVAGLFADIPHCSVVGLCDVQPEGVELAANLFEQKTGIRPAEYTGSATAYLDMLREQRPDAVFIHTCWETHADLAVDVMEHGAHAFVEVPLACSLEQLWRIIDTAERTRRHCMMLENVCYGREELMFLNIVRQGLLGPLLHGEAAYIHDLRCQMLSEDPEKGAWRTYHFAARNGNLYPTHGLGPISQYMSLARGEDTFERLVSFSSPALGRAAYARRQFPANHPWNALDFQCGDMNTAIIKTKLGRTILLQWDETSPRPYDRRNLIQGTEGVLAGYPTRAAGEPFCPAPDCAAANLSGQESYQWYQGKEAEEDLHARYEHPLFSRLGNTEARNNGMDIIMLNRIIECLHAGAPLDQNVYEGALWSAVGPLTEKSVHEGGAPQVFPDFTRGDWQHTPKLPIIP